MKAWGWGRCGPFRVECDALCARRLGLKLQRRSAAVSLQRAEEAHCVTRQKRSYRRETYLCEHSRGGLHLGSRDPRPGRLPTSTGDRSRACAGLSARVDAVARFAKYARTSSSSRVVMASGVGGSSRSWGRLLVVLSAVNQIIGNRGISLRDVGSMAGEPQAPKRTFNFPGPLELLRGAESTTWSSELRLQGSARASDEGGLEAPRLLAGLLFNVSRSLNKT